ncbi:MAG: chemotaxis protein CheW [Planctomycetota bacterium]
MKEPLDDLLDEAEAARAAGSTAWQELAEQEYQVIRFRSGGRELAVAIDAVERTERVPLLTAVPLSPPFVRGVASLRGGVVCVLDLRPLLSAEEGDDVDLGEAKSLLVIRAGLRRVGLLSDNLPDFQRVGRGDTLPVPHGRLEIYRAALKAGGELVGILDPEKLFDLVETRLNG